jgi:hypothetical protein
MLNGWIEAPTSPHELPWDIRAGQRVLWWIKLEVCGEYPARSFVFCGSLKQKHPQQTPYLTDKMLGTNDSLFNYLEVVAYQYMKGPENEKQG